MLNTRNSYPYYDLESYRKKRKITENRKKIWLSSIPFYIEKGLNRNLIVKALYRIQSETCVRFHEVNQIYKHMSGIHYYHGETCASFVGRKLNRKFQKIFIAKFCENLGSITHETLHALGIEHEHNRIDRDKYVSILFKNVNDALIHDFRIAL
uniref:Metalloendopeptidase n=1 Tax=Strongyloides papillosus TaxID=174720 RepID=A0A0N5C0T7_STREA